MKKIYKKISAFALLVTLSQTVSAQATSLTWVKTMNGTGSEWSEGVAVDASGNVYSLGAFNSQVDFDPGPGTFTMNTAGISDVFIQKLDAAGNFIWAKQINGGEAYPSGIALDATGNVCITGTFKGTIDLDPGVGNYTIATAGLFDVFVMKLNSSGNFVWGGQISGVNNESVNGLSLDASGNVFLTGSFMGTADFDPSAGTSTLTAVSPSFYDAYVVKLSNSGSLLWAKQFGSNLTCNGYGLTVDAIGNVYITGSFGGTLDTDPGAGTNNFVALSPWDSYISVLDPSGNFIWAKQIGGPNSEYVQDIAIDATGNVLIAGDFDGTTDFDPGVGTYTLASNGGAGDAFVSKLNSTGNFIWAKAFGGIGSDGSYNVAVDASSNVYIAGFFYNTVDFDPGAGVYNMTSNGIADGYISKLDQNGNFVWSKQLGGTARDVVVDLVVDASYNVYTCGLFKNTVDFDLDAPVVNLTSAGNEDGFVHKMGQTLTNISELNSPNGFKIYPNPTASGFYISNTNITDIIVLTDVLGNEILNVKPTAGEVYVDLSNMASGVYFVRSGIVTKKIIKE